VYFFRKNAEDFVFTTSGFVFFCIKSYTSSDIIYMDKKGKIEYHVSMPRNYVSQGIVFSVKLLGENNSSVCFLTEDCGIVYATLYGGPKSKLRSLVSQGTAERHIFTAVKRTILHGA